MRGYIGWVHHYPGPIKGTMEVLQAVVANATSIHADAKHLCALLAVCKEMGPNVDGFCHGKLTLCARRNNIAWVQKHPGTVGGLMIEDDQDLKVGHSPARACMAVNNAAG